MSFILISVSCAKYQQGDFAACGPRPGLSDRPGPSVTCCCWICNSYLRLVSVSYAKYRQGDFAPAGAIRSAAGLAAFRSPWTFGSILFWRLGESTTRTAPPPFGHLPSKLGRHRLLDNGLDTAGPSTPKECTRRVQRRSESLWPRPQARNLFSVYPVCCRGAVCSLCAFCS